MTKSESKRLNVGDKVRWMAESGAEYESSGVVVSANSLFVRMRWDDNSEGSIDHRDMELVTIPTGTPKDPQG